jgi:O-antigen ligase
MNWDRITTVLICAAAVSLAFPFEFEVMGALLSSVDIAVYGLLLLSIIRFLREPEFRKRKVPYLFPFLAFLLLAIPSRISLIEIKGVFQGAWALFRNFIEIIPLLYLILVLADGGEGRARKAVTALLIAASLCALVGITQTVTGGRVLTGRGVYGNLKYLGIFPPYPAESQGLARENIGRRSAITHLPGTKIYRAHGGLSGHNFFGAFLVLTTGLSLSLALCTRRIYLYIFLFLQILALSLTYSRAALLGFFLSTAIIFFIKKPRLREVVVMGLIFVALAGNIVITSGLGGELRRGLIGRIGSLFIPEGEVPIEFQARWRLWGLALKGIVDSPVHFILGHGSGGVEGFDMLGYRLSAHNDALDLIYTRGVLSFLAVAVFFYLVLRDSLRLFRGEGSPFARAIGLGAYAGILGLLLAGLGQRILGLRDTGALVWFVVGLTVLLVRATKGDSQ